MSQIKQLLFDCDGVLVDSEFLACHLMSNMLRPYGCTTTAEELMHKYVGRKDYEIVGILVEEQSLKLPTDFMDQYVTKLDAELAAHVEAIPHIDQVLAGISLPKAVVSNSHWSRIVTSLKRNNLLQFFDEEKIFSADLAQAAKPDPRIYRFALEKVNCKPEEAIVVEDSPTGVSAAHGAGIKVVGFLAANHAAPDQEEKLRQNGAWKIAHDSQELLRILKEAID